MERACRHPNCEQHGKSPCVGIGCDGRELAEAEAGHLSYLNRTEVARRIGVTPGALSRYKLPPADAMIGDVRGWLPETVDAWRAARPGRGARTDLAAGKCVRCEHRGASHQMAAPPGEQRCVNGDCGCQQLVTSRVLNIP